MKAGGIWAARPPESPEVNYEYADIFQEPARSNPRLRSLSKHPQTPVTHEDNLWTVKRAGRIPAAFPRQGARNRLQPTADSRPPSPKVTARCPKLRPSVPELSTTCPKLRPPCPEPTAILADSSSASTETTCKVPATHCKVPETESARIRTASALVGTDSNFPETASKLSESSRSLPATTSRLPGTRSAESTPRILPKGTVSIRTKTQPTLNECHPARIESLLKESPLTQ